MKSKVGAYAAFVQALALLAVVIFGLVIERNYGLTGAADFMDLKKVQHYVNNAPALYFLDNFVSTILAASILVLAMVMDERLRGQPSLWRRVATNAAVISAALFLGRTMIGLMSPAFWGTIVIPMVLAAIFAYGWWVFLTCWVAMKGGLPRPLTYLGLVWGSLGMIAFRVLPFTVFAPVLGVIWAAWLGLTLWGDA